MHHWRRVKLDAPLSGVRFDVSPVVSILDASPGAVRLDATLKGK